MRLSKPEMRPVFYLGLAAGALALAILVMLGTGKVEEDVPVTSNVDTDRINKQRILESLLLEIEDLKKDQLPSVEEAQASVFVLFPLAERHGATTERVSGPQEPQPGTLGIVSVNTLPSNVEIRGPRSGVIEVLLELDEVFGDTMLLSNVRVSGTEEDWVIEFLLTQYLQ